VGGWVGGWVVGDFARVPVPSPATPCEVAGSSIPFAPHDRRRLCPERPDPDRRAGAEAPAAGRPDRGPRRRGMAERTSGRGAAGAAAGWGGEGGRRRGTLRGGCSAPAVAAGDGRGRAPRGSAELSRWRGGGGGGGGGAVGGARPGRWGQTSGAATFGRRCGRARPRRAGARRGRRGRTARGLSRGAAEARGGRGSGTGWAGGAVAGVLCGRVGLSERGRPYRVLVWSRHPGASSYWSQAICPSAKNSRATTSLDIRVCSTTLLG